MTNGDADAHVAQLRQRRREMRRELARVRWWRRLVRARTDLSVAKLADVAELETLGLDDAWEALAADAPTPTELSESIWPEPSNATPRSVESLAALDARLQSYEERVSENLETVTAQMVRALGYVHGAHAHSRGGAHG
ncbi:hypothetical protein ACNI3K_03355 [Demequina sp. SO4-13]|uniref:hypothetical protein n=1 Tax=Demequina sp. SO4-13 TaxID=3401027 RepID=UPI003AF9C5C5